MATEWIVVTVIAILAVIVIIGYWIAFYKKPKLFKEKPKLYRSLIEIDSKEHSWFCFQDTHLEYKKDKWILFDAMVLTDHSLFVICDLTNEGEIMTCDMDDELWTVKKKKHLMTIKNPVVTYRAQAEKMVSFTRFPFAVNFIYVTDEKCKAAISDGFFIAANHLPQLYDKILHFEADRNLDYTISNLSKKKWVLSLDNKAFEMNKRNILNEADSHL